MTKKSIEDYLVILSIYQTYEYQGRSFLAELIREGESLAASFDDSFKSYVKNRQQGVTSDA
jgi:hypothetical protein